VAVIKGTARQSSSAQHVSEGAEVYLRMLRDGTLPFADFKVVSIMDGRGFTMDAGDFSTGIKNDGTVIDIDEPNWLVSVPDGTTIIPIRIEHSIQGGAPANGEEVESLIAVDQDSAGATLTNMTAATINNMNTLFTRTSGCNGYADSTDTITDPVLDITLSRMVVEYEVLGTNGAASHAGIPQHLYLPDAPVFINGPACLIGYWGGDTAVVGGFATVEWLEFPSSYFA